ncbi:response regulator [Opitutus terrae]|uniref:response regulator n=1 Tax=Opitutus terrae TaxID=107709 RepID=UPI000307A055|nr:response regulator [Opitutus terrae]
MLEDERPQILALRATLQPIGKVVDFSDPLRALDYLNEQQVDAAVIDIHMPEMPLNGVEFIRAVRSFDKDLAVIIRTGDTSIEIAEDAIELRAFRRVIKSKTSVQELREVLRSGIAETRSRRQLSRDAASSADASRRLEQTLGSVEDELSAAECYKAMLHSLRNQLTAIAGFAEVWCAVPPAIDHRLLQDTASENGRVVSRMLADMTAFLEGPFAEPQTVGDRWARADVNATLEILRKRFAAATVWSAQKKSVQISGLHQPLLAEASPIRLLTALRHTTEFCLASSPNDTRVLLRTDFIPDLEHHLARLGAQHLVFNRPARSRALGYVCFDWRAGQVMRSLEQIRRQIHAHPDDPRTGNLHMISLSLGEERNTVVVHVSPENLLSLQLLVPTAE